ncbi:MAG: TVP38/TMEM64 family protein [Clostridia bacterium]|nr:TVP38/TMEM64 family protein [Clostridia bacterium]
MSKSRKNKTQILINLIAIALLLGIAIFVTVRYSNTFASLSTDEGLRRFVEEIQSTGIFGALILCLIQTLQVVVAFIPGEFVELAAGVMFGPLLGLILCLVGLNLGTALIFLLVRRLGRAFVDENVSERDFKRLTFLNAPRRALIILFFIFLIPGIPKDVLIYPIPLTKVKLSHFLIVSSIARIPTIITSTLTGSAVIEENYILAVIMTVISVTLAALGLIFNKRICSLIDKRFPNTNSSPSDTLPEEGN